MRGSDGEINVTNGGELQIRNGLTVNPDTVEPFLQIARNSGSNGAVTVDGSGSLIQLLQDLPGNPDAGFFGPTVQVGRLGTGSLTVSNNGQIRLDGDHSAMVVGARFGSSGSLDILSGGDVVIDGGSNAEHGGAGFARFGAAGQFYSRASVAVDAGSSIQVLGDETEIILGGSGLLDATIEGVIQNAGVSVSTTTIGSSDNYRVDVVVQGGGQLLAGNVLNIGAGLSEGRASLTVGAGSQVSAGTIFLQEAGRLAGSGQVITGLLQVDGGTVDPGLSPGLLSVSGDLLVNDGLLRFEVEGETAGSEHDRISVTGDASLHGGVVEIDFNAGLLLSGLGPINLLTTGGALSTDGSTSFRLVGVDTHDVLDYSITAGANALTLDVIDMYGGEGIVFEGGSRNDFERGGDGDDLLMGGLGDDTLGGGSGSDTLNGGGGFDRFQVTHDVLDPMGFNGDVITIQDFNPLEDVLELIGASSGGFGSLFIDEDINGNANVHIGGKIIVLVDVGQEELNAFNVVMRVTADGTLFTNPDGKIFLGGDGDGSIAISDGAVFDSGPARIAVDGFNNGSVDVSGGGTLWRITTDDVDDAVVVGNNNNGDGDSTGFLGTLDISDGARVRIAGDEATPFVSTGLIIGRGGHGSVEITNGGELEILDPALIGQDVFLLLGGSGAQQNGVGEMLVDGAGSRVLMQGETVSVAVGRNGFDAEGVLTISSDAEFELTGISGAFFNLGREGANGTLQIDGGRLYINSALDPALQLGRHGDSFAIATVENGGLIEINGSEAFLAVGRVGHSESPM